MSFTKFIFLMLILAIAENSFGTVLWVGGEDMDFPNGTSPCVQTNASYYRANYARVSLCVNSTGNLSWSNSFSPSVTSAWLSARVWKNSSGTSIRWFGLGKYGTMNSLWVGNSSANSNKVALWKYDGTTWTQLASEAGVSINTFQKMDMQVTSYGAAATVNIYIGGNAGAALTYTGDVTAGGNTDLNNVFYGGATGSWNESFVSEFIVADTDTRLMSAMTLVPSAAGTTNTWTGAYTDINETSTNDTTLITSGTSGQTFQCNLNDMPGGSYTINSVRITARAAKSGSGPGALALGVYTNSTASVPAAVSLIPAFSQNDIYYPQNPVTSAPWTSSEINSLQFNFQSAP